jgi:hypothetical protein
MRPLGCFPPRELAVAMTDRPRVLLGFIEVSRFYVPRPSLQGVLATKQSRGRVMWPLDCFPPWELAVAMTDRPRVLLGFHSPEVAPPLTQSDASGAENRSCAPSSLIWRINSLLVANRFPVVDELIPCSVAQGISGAPSHKLLNSQMFSRRTFKESGRFGQDSLLFTCYGALRASRLQPNFAPTPSINARKFGKLVAIIAPSSTLIPRSAAMPITRKLIAMR